MGNKPSRVRQREVELMIRGARNEGCKQIEIRWGTDARRSSSRWTKTISARPKWSRQRRRSYRA